MYIASQILVFIGVVFDFTGRFFKNKKAVISFNVVGMFFYVSSYIFLFSWLGVVANALNFIRNVLYLYFDKEEKSKINYLITFVSVVACFIPALVLFWENALNLFLLFSLIITSVGFAFKNVLIVRITIVINSVFWAIFNFSIGGYVNFACDMLGLSIALFSITIYNIIPKIKENKQIKNNKDLIS